MIRGFPFWLREVPGIAFRTDNEPFKVSLLIIIPEEDDGGCFFYAPKIETLKIEFINIRSLQFCKTTQFSVSYGKICIKYSKHDEDQRLVCFTRRSHYTNTGKVKLI